MGSVVDSSVTGEQKLAYLHKANKFLQYEHYDNMSGVVQYEIDQAYALQLIAERNTPPPAEPPFAENAPLAPATQTVVTPEVEEKFRDYDADEVDADADDEGGEEDHE